MSKRIRAIIVQVISFRNVNVQHCAPTGSTAFSLPSSLRHGPCPSSPAVFTKAARPAE